AAGGLLAVSAPAQAAPALKWSRRLPGVVVRNSSPTPASLDGQSSIAFGGMNGQLFVLHGSDGSNSAGFPQALSDGIQSSPSVADTNGAGRQELYVGVGLAGPAFPPGAEYSLDNTGAVRFKYTTDDPSPNQTTQAVQSTAAVGDINRDGVADVTFG